MSGIRTAPRRGFTLVELLVVIGIIGLLMSILLPTLSRARQSANAIDCQARLRETGMGLSMYANDNALSYPWGMRIDMEPDPDPSTPRNDTNSTWDLMLVPLFGGEGDGTFEGTPFKARQERIRALWDDKDTTKLDATQDNAYFHYSTHPRIMPEMRDFGGGNYLKDFYLDRGPRRPYKISGIGESSKKLTVFDATQVFPYNGGSASVAYNLDGNAITKKNKNYMVQPEDSELKNYPDGFLNEPIDAGTNLDATGFGAQFANIRFRHKDNTTCNALAGDGHVEAFTYKSRFESGITRDMVLVPAPN